MQFFLFSNVCNCPLPSSRVHQQTVGNIHRDSRCVIRQWNVGQEVTVVPELVGQFAVFRVSCNVAGSRMLMALHCVMGVNNILTTNTQFIDQPGLLQGLINSKGDVDFIVIFPKFLEGKITYNSLVVLELFFRGSGTAWFTSLPIS